MVSQEVLKGREKCIEGRIRATFYVGAVVKDNKTEGDVRFTNLALRKCELMEGRREKCIQERIRATFYVLAVDRATKLIYKWLTV